MLSNILTLHAARLVAITAIGPGVGYLQGISDANQLASLAIAGLVIGVLSLAFKRI